MDATMTKNKIIAGAKHIFFTRGFDAATLDEIAAVSGVNQALINYHFRTKRTLYRFIVLLILESEIYPEFLKLIKEADTVKRLDQLRDLTSTIIRKYPWFPLIMLNKQDPIYNDIMLWMDKKNTSSEMRSVNDNTNAMQLKFNKVQDIMVLLVLSAVPVTLKNYFAPVLTETSERLFKILVKSINTTLSSVNEG